MRHTDAWTREQMDFLSKRYKLPGWSAARISAEMPGPYRSTNSVRMKAKYLGLSKINVCKLTRRDMAFDRYLAVKSAQGAL